MVDANSEGFGTLLVLMGALVASVLLRRLRPPSDTEHGRWTRCRARLHRTPTRVAALRDGQRVVVLGTVQPLGDLATAPLTGRPAIAWRAHAMDGPEGIPSEAHAGAADLVLDDGSGTLVVRAATAYVLACSPPPVRFTSGRTPNHPFTSASSFVSEWAIPPGTRLAVFGRVVMVPDDSARASPTHYREMPLRPELHPDDADGLLIAEPEVLVRRKVFREQIFR